MADDSGVDITASYRRKLANILQDIRDIRDQGKLAEEDPSHINLFKGMYTTLSPLFDRYDTLYNELCDLIEDDGSPVAHADDHQARARAKRYMHEAHAFNLMFQREPQMSLPGLRSTTLNVSSSRARAKLPTIILPAFTGIRAEWPRFRDLFESLVIGDDELRDVDRFHYLVASVKDQAAAVIANFPINDLNFMAAWKSLKDVYDNKRLLASTYLDELLSAKVLERKPSTQVLSERLAMLSNTVAAFNLLDIQDGLAFVFFHLACRSLDTETRIAFENFNSTQFPKFESLIEFLRKRCAASELAVGSASTSGANKVQQSYRTSPKPTNGGKSVLFTNQHSNKQAFNRSSADGKPSQLKHVTSSVSTSKAKFLPGNCFVCGDKHRIIDCVKFSNASMEVRHQLLDGWKGCRNCLLMSHQTRDCPSKYRCRFCRNKHHSLLCLASSSPKAVKGNLPESPHSNSLRNPEPGPSSIQGGMALKSTVSRQVDTILGTALCCIGVTFPEHPVRIVIDSGSHFSFVTRECATRVGLHISPYHTDIWGIGETPLVGFKGQAKCSLSPLRSRFPKLSTSVIVVEKITGPLPGFSTSPEIWQPYTQYELADPEFWVSKPIDILLGCDLFGDILTGDVISVQDDMPKLVGTIFGFAVMGRLKDLSEAVHICSLHALAPPDRNNLDMDLQRFWELEEPPSVKQLSPDDERCEEIFRDTHYRLPSGKYGVRLPFKTPKPKFIGTRAMALRRLTHMESKLARNNTLKEKYHAFLKEYLDLGHMSLATHPGQCYLPHHCVVKGAGENMKIRVVFDAAARTTTGSLNDVLYTGPSLQTNQTNILLGFRLHKYVFTTDVVKMYRIIEVHEKDRPYQYILWRFDSSEPVKEYVLNTLTYGTSCAPYEALRVIKQLINDEGAAFPLAACVLQEDMYIDDVVTGAPTLQEVLSLLRQVVELLSKGEFYLSKWAANHADILSAIQENDATEIQQASEPVSLESSEDNMSVKILGLQWDPCRDTFSYKINPPECIFTKRGVLSSVAKIYDPLGYLAPAVVLAKCIVQRAWKLRLDWDTPFPLDLENDWRDLLKQLPKLADLQLPRWILPSDTSDIKILVFADASERAYCATSYLRTVSSQGTHSHLLLAKTKLSPVKPVTIPRLELCAAFLAARLWESLQPFCQRLPLTPQALFFTDSTIVLAWLRTPAFQLKTFVANRVVKIRELSAENSWHHVSSLENPSDLGSRGMLPEHLLNCSLWYNGPSWVTHDQATWPLLLNISLPDVPERKPMYQPVVLTSSKPVASVVIEWFERFSSFTKLIRSFAYVLRYINILKKENQRYDQLSLNEIRRSTQIVIKLVQAKVLFHSDVFVTNKTRIPDSLSSLNPFFDEEGLLLVGGRLRHAGSSCMNKHPTLLPAKSHVSRLIVEHYHHALLHPGATVLLAVLRTKYWIINARSLVRSITRTCVTCRKYSAPPIQPLMGDLPSSRFREGRAFLHTGSDFAGPFILRETLRRKAPHFKAYLCIFVCLSTKAVHLELVSDLSTAAFCAAFDRFVGRRGLPEKLFTDNGTNFVGAANSLRDLYMWIRQTAVQTSLSSYAAEREVEWSFIPPKAPFHGGVWEAGVKSVKRLLRTVYGQNILTFEELSTWLVKVEAILNSRPLCPLSSDPNDLGYLSPGHFLIGTPLLAVPEKSFIGLSETRLSRWQLVCQKAQHFWQRWRDEYITSLQRRNKWRSKTQNLKLGDLVLVKDEQAPRMHWPMARVIKVHPGQDNIVRVATVRTINNELKRPVNKLIPLFFPKENPPS